jgi:hypothetical protein
MTRDRMGADEFQLTQETVAAMRVAAPRLLLSVCVGLAIAVPVMLAVWFVAGR